MDSSKVSQIFDSSFLQNQTHVPKGFIWPDEDLPSNGTKGVLNEPLVDLEGFLNGDEMATVRAAELIREACTSHGFFQVINHGIDSSLINLAHEHLESFFKLPASEKINRAPKRPGCLDGYSAGHSERFATKLPWKETLTFFHESGSVPVVKDYFTNNLGKDFEQKGIVYQRYSESMMWLCLKLTELLAISLGVDRMHYKKFFEDAHSIVRINYYPSCTQPDLTLGVGAHCDPTSITILHQDQVGGLEVFQNNKWNSVRPVQDAFVINIGDTFVALSNGIYKSCLHRVVVNRDENRKSMVFFLCPKEDKVVRRPHELVLDQGTRQYPDFTWSELLLFTSKYYRADPSTLQKFILWQQSSKPISH
ncbi:Gibberellin 20 oxidase 3 [Morus notabilis]|uniref:Gibberellin 20 oxidase 3 n=1 Tax=Morus notabilis TaxID=981085 RepID=W9RWU0_9ROSA|nr:gibberellin 20 oxidase 3 [Morus notabilis]EXB75633.1 Gibberellin 20 oxidase 3 [Morus notabilis]